MGGELQCTTYPGRPPCGMGIGEPPWPSAAFPTCLRPPPRPCARLLAPLETSLKGRRRSSSFFSVFGRHHRLAPPLTTAVVEPYPAKTTAPLSSPRSRVSSGLPAPAQFLPNHPHDRLLSYLRWPSATEPPHVANHLHCLSVLADCSTALVVSCWCFPCLLV
jgi:hypothetical protein